MKKIIIGKYDKDTYGDHLEYFKEASIELIEEIKKLTPNLPLDDIEHNSEMIVNLIIDMNDLLQDYDDLFISEKLTSSIRTIGEKSANDVIKSSSQLNTEHNVKHDIQSIRMPLLFEKAKNDSLMIASIVDSLGFKLNQIIEMEELLLDFLEKINLDDINDAQFKKISEEFDIYIDRYETSYTKILETRKALNGPEYDTDIPGTKRDKIMKKILLIAKECYDKSTGSELNQETLMYWMSKGGLKPKKKRRFPKRKDDYSGLIMKDAVFKALKENNSLSPKELSKEIFSEEALIEEGARIDKNIAAVLNKEKGNLFVSEGNGKWGLK